MQGVAFLLGRICFAKLERFSEIQQPRRPRAVCQGRQGPRQVEKVEGRALHWPRGPPQLPAAGRICQRARRVRKGQTERETVDRALGWESGGK